MPRHAQQQDPPPAAPHPPPQCGPRLRGEAHYDGKAACASSSFRGQKSGSHMSKICLLAKKARVKKLFQFRDQGFAVPILHLVSVWQGCGPDSKSRCSDSRSLLHSLGSVWLPIHYDPFHPHSQLRRILAHPHEQMGKLSLNKVTQARVSPVS